MIIDAHTHLGSATVEDLLAGMDEGGIDYALVIAADFFGNLQKTEDLIEECRQGEERLRVIGSVCLAKGIEQQLAKLRQYLEEGKIVGIKLYPGYEDYYPNDERLRLIYEYCQEEGVTVVYHTGVLLAGSRGILKQVRPLEIDQVAHQYPDLRIVMAHMGNPWLTDCAVVMEKNKNVYADMSGFFPEYKAIKQEGIDIFKQKMNIFLDFAGNFNKCLFGTDFPLYKQKEYVAAVEQLEMGEEEKDLVFWKNARDLFKLKF